MITVTKNFFQRGRSEQGTVTIEMALVTLLVSTVLFGVVEIARYGWLRYQLDRATYHAARYLVLNPNQIEAARAMVNAEVAHNVWGNVQAIRVDYKNVQRDGECLLFVESRTDYHISALEGFVSLPDVESVQLWPQRDACKPRIVHRPVATRMPTPTATLVAYPSSAPLKETEGTAIANANIRLGPGFEYVIVGRLNEKENVQVRGRDETGTWLQVAPERIGWVYAPLIEIKNPVSSLQIVPAPPLPPGTPMPPSYLEFDATQRVLKRGECAVLRWNARNAQFATLNEKNVPTLGNAHVCPTSNTRYVLSAGYANDQIFDRELKILIYPASDP